jgi:hypothetical protein
MLRIGLLAVAAIGALLLVVSDFQTLYEIKVLTVTKSTIVGHSQHSFGMLLIGLAALAMTASAALATRAARAAFAALAVLGLVALLIVLINDLPDVNSTGLVGQLYAEASAGAKIGFYMETLGAVALIFSGVSLFVLSLSGGGVRRAGRPTRRRAVEPAPRASGPIDAEDAGWL